MTRGERSRTPAPFVGTPAGERPPALSDLDRRRMALLYERLGPVIYRRSLHLLRDRERARDATQDVFVKLLQERRAERPWVLSLAWVYRVTTNHCLNVLRAAGHTDGDPALVELEPARDAADPGDAHLARAVLERFDAVTQAVAVGILVHEMEHDELAAVLGISPRTVYRKCERFLVNARKFLARGGP